jgi:hypothetical protein
MVAGVRLLQYAARELLKARAGSQRQLRRTRRFWPWLILATGFTVAMFYSRLPMQFCFEFSRASFDKLAQTALRDRADLQKYARRWVGLYQLAGVRVIGDTVVLYIGTFGGSYGFARVPGAKTDIVFNVSGSEAHPDYYKDFPEQDGMDPAGRMVDPIGRRVDGDWFVIYSDYRESKRGCS